MCVAACTTTHDLGRVGDPGVQQQIDALAARRGTTAHVTPLPGARAVPPDYRIAGSTTGGLKLSLGAGEPAPVPYAQIRSLSTFDHARGARDGAVTLGLVGIVLGVAFAVVLSNARSGCTDGCPPPPDAGSVALRAGGLFGLVGAALGGAIGAVAGHQDAYVLDPS